MTSKQLQQALRRCAHDALQKYPSSPADRAATFISLLAGWIEGYGDHALSVEVFSVLRQSS